VSPLPAVPTPGAGLAGLRIAFLVDSFPALSETFVLNQITGLLHLGHDVDIYATWTGPDRRVHRDVGAYRLDTRVAYPAAGGHPRLRALGAILRARATLRPGAIGGLLGAVAGRLDRPRLRLLPICLRRFQENPYQIAQCHFALNGMLGVVLKDLGASCKVVTMFHRYDLRRLESRPSSYAPLRDRGDCFLAISRYSRARLERLGFPRERIVDHPVGIDLSRLPFRGVREPGQQPLEILTVARLAPQKGLDHGIRAFHRLVADGPPGRMRYTILGGGPLEGELRALAASLGLDDTLRFLGEADQTQVAEAMLAADIFLLPSVDEILPLALMEGQAVGLPVVATDVGAIREIVEDGRSGFVVPPSDPLALEAALRRLLDQPETWPAMGRAGRQRVADRYDLRVLNPRLVEIYRGLIGAELPR
jgi:colanic acid/amylovoran biosynthesis glycosyltransferase